jgi:hypothetical protein
METITAEKRRTDPNESAKFMTKREAFAKAALIGALQWDAEINERDHAGNVPEIVKSCVKIADTLIAELNKD